MKTNWFFFSKFRISSGAIKFGFACNWGWFPHICATNGASEIEWILPELHGDFTRWRG